MPKTTYDKKTGTKTVLDEKGKTVYFKDGKKETYNSKGKTIYFPDGTKETLNSKGKTVYFPDGSKTTYNSKGKTEYTAAEAAALKKAIDKNAADKKAAAKANANKLISTVKGTSAINTKSKPESKAKSNFNYYTELAKTQKAATDKKTTDKKTTDKKVKTVVESLIRPKTVIAPKTQKAATDKKTTDKKVKTPTGKTVSEIWKEKTGTSWSEAKKQGLTDGSMKANLALMSKLKSGDYKPKPKEEVKVEPKPYVPAGFPARTDGPIAGGEQLNEMRRGGKVMATRKPKMAMGGTKKIVLKKPVKKAMYGTAMKPTMMRSSSTTKKYLTGGTTGTPKYDDQPKKATTLKKAMYGTMMKPKIMIKGRVTKKK
jgi:hypothetical protein